MVKCRLRSGVWMVLATSLGACGAIDPYIYTPHEFDRNSPTFNKPPKDRDEVTICYNGIATSRGNGRRAGAAGMRQVRQDGAPQSRAFGDCPLLTPVEARFACVKAQAE